MILVWVLLSLASLLTLGLLCLFARVNTAGSAAALTAPQPGARLCRCTDGGRNQPLAACPHCRGEGWVR